MTLKTDFIRLETSFFGELNLRATDLGLEWPPPERLVFDDHDGGMREATPDDPEEFVLERISMSTLTDEQAEEATNIARGARYRYLKEV